MRVKQQPEYLFFPVDMMIMDLLTVGTPQGIMTVEATVSVKGRGHQAMAMIIMGAGILIIQSLKFRVVWLSDVIIRCNTKEAQCSTKYQVNIYSKIIGRF